MKHWRALFTTSAFAMAIFLGCGGGGGGDDEGNAGPGGGSVNVSGFWKGVATVSSNTCNLPLDLDAINFSANVNQSGSAVSLVDEVGDQYSGMIIGNDGFDVTAPPESISFPIKTDCTLSREVQYRGISSANTANVVYSYTGPCAGAGGTCSLVYTGTATRGAAPTPFPTITPTPGSNAGRGACPTLQQRSYTGNGGCGFLTTALTANTGGITLNPSGTTGPIVFVDSTTDDSTATSTSSSITIGAATGYTCVAQCFPPANFSVTCTQASGTS